MNKQTGPTLFLCLAQIKPIVPCSSRPPPCLVKTNQRSRPASGRRPRSPAPRGRAKVPAQGFQSMGRVTCSHRRCSSRPPKRWWRRSAKSPRSQLRRSRLSPSVFRCCSPTCWPGWGWWWPAWCWTTCRWGRPSVRQCLKNILLLFITLAFAEVIQYSF